MRHNADTDRLQREKQVASVVVPTTKRAIPKKSQNIKRNKLKSSCKSTEFRLVDGVIGDAN